MSSEFWTDLFLFEVVKIEILNRQDYGQHFKSGVKILKNAVF